MAYGFQGSRDPTAVPMDGRVEGRGSEASRGPKGVSPWTPIRGIPACVWAVALFPHLVAQGALGTSRRVLRDPERALRDPRARPEGPEAHAVPVDREGAFPDDWKAWAAGPEAQRVGRDPAFRAFVAAWLEAPRWSALPTAVQGALVAEAEGLDGPEGLDGRGGLGPVRGAPSGPSGLSGPSDPSGWSGPKGPSASQGVGGDLPRDPQGEDPGLWGPDADARLPQGVTTLAEDAHGRGIAVTLPRPRYPAVPAAEGGPQGPHALVAWTPGWARWRRALASFPGLYARGPGAEGADGIRLGVAYQGEFVSPGTAMAQAHAAWYVLMPSGTRWPTPSLARWRGPEGLEASEGGDGREAARRTAEAWVRGVHAVGADAEAFCAQIQAEDAAQAVALQRAVKRGTRALLPMALAQVRGTPRLAWGSRAVTQAWAQVQAVAEGSRALGARRTREALGRRARPQDAPALWASVRPVQVHPDDPRFGGWVKVSKGFLEAFLGIPLDRATGGHPAVEAYEAFWRGTLRGSQPQGAQGAQGAPGPQGAAPARGALGPGGAASEGPDGRAGADAWEGFEGRPGGLRLAGPSKALAAREVRARKAQALVRRLEAAEAGRLRGRGGPRGTLEREDPRTHEGRRLASEAEAWARGEEAGDFGTPTFFLVGGLEAYRGLGYAPPSPLRPMPAGRERRPMGPFHRPIPVPQGQGRDDEGRFGTRVPTTFLTPPAPKGAGTGKERGPPAQGRRFQPWTSPWVLRDPERILRHDGAGTLGGAPRSLGGSLGTLGGSLGTLGGAPRAPGPATGDRGFLATFPRAYGGEASGEEAGSRPLTSLGIPGTARWRPWRSPRAWVHTEWRHRPALVDAYDRFEAILARLVTGRAEAQGDPLRGLPTPQGEGAPRPASPFVATPVEALLVPDADLLGLDGA